MKTDPERLREIWTGSEPLPVLIHPVPCKKCSCSVLYIDYDPRVTSGGVKVDCPRCKGRGWVERGSHGD